MLFSKSIFAVAILALSNVVAANTPTNQTPACVLKIIGNQPNPADSKTICGSDASKIQSAISKSCSDSETSLKFFASNCAQLGHKVATSESTATATGATATGTTATGTSGSSTATGFVTAVSSGTSTQTGTSAGATGTGSSAAAGSAGSATESGAASSPTSSFSAASSDRQFSATTFVAAVFLGAAALL